MSVTVLTKPKHKSKAEYEAIATQLLVEINRTRRTYGQR